MFSIEEILDMAIKIEKNGEAVYRAAIERLDNSSLVSLLEWMAEEEGRHARWFEKFKDDIHQNQGLTQNETEAQGLINNLLEGQSFSLGDTDFGDLSTVEELLSVSIEFEHDTILFYEMLRPFILDERTRDQLDQIIEEERRHIAKLKDFMSNPVAVGADIK